MATSKCAKCEKTSFEIKEVMPNGANHSVCFVQCANCGVVIGVREHYSIAAMLFEQNEAIKSIASTVGASVKFKTK